MNPYKQFTLKEVGDQTVAMPKEGSGFTGFIRLNETAALIWELLADDVSLTEAALTLTECYQVSPERAAAACLLVQKAVAKTGITQ